LTHSDENALARTGLIQAVRQCLLAYGLQSVPSQVQLPRKRWFWPPDHGGCAILFDAQDGEFCAIIKHAARSAFYGIERLETSDADAVFCFRALTNGGGEGGNFTSPASTNTLHHKTGRGFPANYGNSTSLPSNWIIAFNELIAS